MQYIIVGVGGQGILFTSRVLGKIAIDRGLPVIGSEVHGMAQRGGSVISHFSVGDYSGPLVTAGRADVVMAFDQNEGIRNLAFLRDGGTFVVNMNDPD
ncbi:MAG: 2-oxoacid:acceptor oxidoreductase family protein, partial [Synergistaceae bacterium]|nr:2-oxoacid:acceptor oxidoreductase family protein [Synergistaceae bacterium]